MASIGPAPNVIREGIRDLLAVLAIRERQLESERDVPIAHVPAELVCMCSDDLYHPDDAAFVRPYSAPELAALQEFNLAYRLVGDELEPLAASEGEPHPQSVWARVSPAASAAQKVIDGG